MYLALFLERGRQSLSCSNINVTYRAHAIAAIWKEGYQEMCVLTSTPFPDLDTCYGHDGLTNIMSMFSLIWSTRAALK
jgi:hypothetical protein